MNYTQEQIAQALMINYRSDIVSNIDRERTPSHLQDIQLFAIDGITRFARLHMVYLPREGELIEFALIPMRIHNPVSNVPAYRNRVQYIQVSMDTKETMNDEQRMIIRNSNPFILNEVFLPLKKLGKDGVEYNNPYNCLDVTGFFRLAPVPAQYNNASLIQAFNKCSENIRIVHSRLKEEYKTKGIDLSTNIKYREAMDKLYAKYQEDIKSLLASGHVQIAQVINVDDSSLIPGFKLDSSKSSNNPYLDAVGMLQTGISYMPVKNVFFGFAKVNSDATSDDLNSKITTGLRELGRNSDVSEEATNTKAKRNEATRLATINDTFGNSSTILLRRQDQGYINPKNTNQLGLAEIFNNATENNESLFIRGTYLPLVAAEDTGGNTNGILRGTVVISEYTKQQSVSLSSTSEASTSVFNEVNSDNISELVGGLDFSTTSSELQEETSMLSNIDEEKTDSIVDSPKHNII